MTVRIITGDCREVLPTLPADSFDCVVTSPPYFGLRDYGVEGQIGLEPTLAVYLETMVWVCRELRRVLKPSGTFWLNVGSCYSGSGKGGNPPNSPHQKQATNRGSLSVSGDKNPILFPRPARARLCDSGGKGPLDYLGSDSACFDRGDELQGDSQNHRGRTLGTPPPLGQSSQLHEPTTLRSGRLDRAQRGAPSFRLPIGLSSLRSALGASYREVPVSASQPQRQRYSCDEIQRMERASGRTDLGKVSRTSDKDASARACDCNSCGICFIYLATRCLKFKAKDLILVPDLLALAFQADGWFLRSEIVWAKPNPMPESVTDRPTCAHEKVWLLTKSEQYFYDVEAVAETTKYPIPDDRRVSGAYQQDSGRNDGGEHRSGGFVSKGTRNARNVWTIASEPYRGAHYAVMPSTLAERCIKAGSSERGCCPHCGKPWERVRGEAIPTGGRGAGNGFARPERISVGGRGDEAVWVPKSRETVGWKPTCDCHEIGCLSCDFVLAPGYANRKTTTAAPMQNVQRGVPPVEAGSELLLPSLLRDEAEHDSDEDVSAVPADISAGEQRGEILRLGLLDQMDRSAQGELQGGKDSEQSGLRDAAHAGASECTDIGLCDGTSRGDGAQNRAPVAPNGSCSSHQRNNNRQRSEQPGNPTKKRPRQKAQAHLHGDVPSLSGDFYDAGECPCCRGRLVIRPPKPEPAKVLDCFGGAGTTGLVADRLGRHATMIELNPANRELGAERVRMDGPLFAEVSV